MIFRKVSIIILIIFFVFLSASCQNKEVKNNDKKNNIENKAKLSSYIMESSVRAFDSAISMHNKKQHGVIVEYKSFNNYEEYIKTLTTELMAGKGPDLIYSNWYEIPSINKLILSGVFADLNKLISNDKAFNPGDYFENVINCGIIKNKRYYLPIRFEPPIFAYSAGTPAKYGINMDNWTLNDFTNSAQRFFDENRSDGKYFCYTYVQLMLLKESASFIDYGSREADLDSQEFIDILQKYKNINGYICTEETALQYKNAFLDMLADNSLTFFDIMGYSSISFINQVDSILKSNYKQSLDICSHPTYNGNGKLKAFIDSFIAINSNSSNEKYAYEFIKTVLSEETQSQDIAPNFPVNKKAYNNLIKDYTSQSKAGQKATGGFGTSKGSINIEYVAHPLSNNLVAKMDTILANIESGALYDYTLNNFIAEVLPKFLDGKKSAAQTAKELNDKVNLYLNE